MKKTIIIFLALILFCVPAMAGMQAYWIDGHKYYLLYKICEKKDIEYVWDSIGRIATLSKNGIEGKIRIGSDKMLIDGAKLMDVGPPVFFYGGSVVIPSSFSNKNLDRIFKARRKTKFGRANKRGSVSTHTIKRIVLDPGHGGKDPGAIGRYTKIYEKTINLDIAKRLKIILSSYGIKVYLTRDKDIFIPLADRAEYANRKKADFFISLHSNSSRSRWLNGFEVYYLSEKRVDDSERALKAAKEDKERKFDTTAKAIEYDLMFTENRIESKGLAGYLIKAVRKKGIYAKRRDPRDARFHVLKNFKTAMPAVLVEMGYISNKKEESLLRRSSYRQKMAQALASGILAYKKEYERQRGFTR